MAPFDRLIHTARASLGFGALGFFSWVCGCSDPITSRGDEGENGGTGATAGTNQEAGASGDPGGAGAEDGGGATGIGGASGEAGAGGASVGGDLTPPSVITISPEDGSAEVERDVVIRIELSEPIEPTRVAAALRVMGPEGQIPGELSVAESVITFSPDQKLWLSSEYTVSLDATLIDLAGNRLDTATSSTFRVRDGKWTDPTTPLGTDASLNLRVSAGNRAGDLFLGGNDAASPPAAWGAIYDAQSDTWTMPETLASHETLTAYIRGVALGESGAASITWWLGSSSSGGGWHLYDRDGFGSVAALTNTFNQLTAVSRNNRALLVSQSDSRFVYHTILDLESGTMGAQEERGDHDETLHSLLSTGDDFVLVATHSPEADTYVLNATRHLEALGFQEPEVVASSSVEQLGVISASDELGNVILLWSEALELWSRVYSAESGDWLDAERVTSGASARWNSISMSGGHAVASFYSDGALSLAYYEAEVGWLDEGIVAIGPAEGGSVTLDSRGNALAVWDRSANFRRYVAGDGWQPVESLELTSNPASFGVFTTRDGQITLVAADQSVTPERPISLRFE